MTDAYLLSKDMFDAWRECVLKNFNSGISDPKMFPLVPVFVSTSKGLEQVESIQLMPDLGGMLLNLVEIEK